MGSSKRHEGLSIGYRIGYRLRQMGLTVFGPAQLGEANDPKARLARERAAKVAKARHDREARAGRSAS